VAIFFPLLRHADLPPRRRYLCARRIAAPQEHLQLVSRQVQRAFVARRRRPPAKLARGETFCREPESLAIECEDANRRRASVPEHKQGPAEGLSGKRLAAYVRKPVDPVSKINRLNRQ